MRAMKIGATLAATAMAAFAITGCSQGAASTPIPTPTTEVDSALRELVPQAILDAGIIRAGGNFDNPPVIAADLTGGGHPEGLAPEILAEAAKILGLETEWSNIAFPGQLPGLESGNFDVVMGQISDTMEREKEILDLVPYVQWPLSLLVPAGNPQNLTDFESLCGHIAAVDVGSVFVRIMTAASEKYCVSQGQPQIVVQEFNGTDETAIRSGNADFAPGKAGVNEGLAAADPDSFESVDLPEDQGFEFDQGILAIGVSKSNPGLSEALAGALAILLDNGRYEEILEEHTDAGGFPRVPIRVNPLTDTPAGEKVAP